MIESQTRTEKTGGHDGEGHEDGFLCGPTAPPDFPIHIHKWFEIQAQRNPNSVAVMCEGREVTYKELDAASSRLADLAKNNVQEEGGLVGVSMQRSIEVVTALLGVLKAGCAYVPLDPDYPSERVTYMVGDACTSLVFTDNYSEKLFLGSSARILNLDRPWPTEGVGKKSRPGLAEDSMAYVLYTSGSTGRPKGVCCLHKGVTNLLADFQQRQPLGRDDVCSWWTSLNFDVSVYEIFSPLLAGATLTIVPEHVRPDGPALMEWLYLQGVTSAYIPPFMVADLEAWVGRNQGKSRLRRLLVGVEPIIERILLAIQRGVPGLQIINGYGPTETTVCATLYSVDAQNGIHENAPIGKPVRNMVLRIFDDQGKPVPKGIPGELHIGGAGLARGYLNREDITAARFIRDPFSKRPEDRLYKTGDKVRLLEDGNLEFVGRTDFQVKIRGFRVELGEIETQLRKLEEIREAVVLLREDEPGYRRLVAYVVIREEGKVSAESIRSHLKQCLPHYMVPDAIVNLDRIPSTPNGKTDREALPRPSCSNLIHAGEEKPSAPRTHVESTLLVFFRDILRLPHIGIHDNFFALGGHSLLAVQLASRIREAFRTEFSVAEVFRSPTVEALAKDVEALLSLPTRLCVQISEPQDESREQVISFSQMRVWYLDQLEPGTPAYNICLTYKLTGAMDLGAMTKSIGEIVSRHQSLRTFFQTRGSGPVPVLRPDGEFTPAYKDLTYLSEEDRESEALRLCNKEAQTGFDLHDGPLFRCILFRSDAEEHILMITVHHIVSDGWSMGIIVRELMQLYSGIISGEPMSLPSLPYQYSDFARDQKNWMSTESSHSQIRFWKQHFLDIPEPLDMITDRPRPPIQSYRGSSVSLTLDEAISGSVSNMAAKKGATRFMVLLAAFKALLNRYTQQGDICVGTFSANRNRREIEDIVGFFVNTLPIRTDLSDDPSFGELVERVKKNALGAFTNQDLPFERLLQEVNPERNLSRTPLFQAMFVLQNMPLPDLKLKGLMCESIELETWRSNFDLTAWVYDPGDSIKMVLDYSTELFDRDPMSRFLGHYRILLADACQRPDAKISQLDLLGESESPVVLDDRSGKHGEGVLSERLVTDLFEEQVRQAPNQTALVALGVDGSSSAEYSYSEIEKEANRIAHFLRRRRVGPETVVAMQMERSPQLIMAILGVHKAGGAYLPIDPNYPVKRAVFMLNDAASPLVLTDSLNFSKLQAILSDQGLMNPPEVICIDTYLNEPEDTVGGSLSKMADPANAAYVMYTSGSTGNPKGVIVEHRALAAFTQSAMELYGWGPNDRILQFASPSFDASVEEIFVSLASGATLVLRSDDMLRSIPTFIAACHDAGITSLDLPTAFWHQLTRALEDGFVKLPECVRLVIVGGEQLASDVVTAWTRVTNSHVRLLNTYGPTEATVVTTAMDLSSPGHLVLNHARVPIGRSLRHAKTYVLDTDLRPVPFTVPGELFIGGKALARGYLNLPEKTQEVFIQNPYGRSVGDRLYRTGDRVRMRPNGVLEFLRRIDRQVKIRGFRVELGEVEAALRTLPEIQEAAVVANTDINGLVRLVAYVVPSQGIDTTQTDIRTRLSSKLPDFMIPSAFMNVDKLPLTRAGKIDTRALPNPEQSIDSDGVARIPPRNPVETVLADIWREVFGIPGIGVQDNFFDLGGHSLLSLRIIDQVSRSGMSITPAQFLQNPTIESQAKVVVTTRPSEGAGSWRSIVELQPYGERPPIFLLHSTPGDVIGYMNLINRLGLDQPCFGFQSLGLSDPGRAHKTVEEMATYYIQELLKFRPKPPYYLVGWCYGGIVAAEMAIQMIEQGIDVGVLVLIETPFPKPAGVHKLLYYMKRLLSLAQMGPSGWKLYLRNRRRYREKIKSGDMERLFALELDQGPLANRSVVYRNNWHAVSNYRMKGFPLCPIRLFTGQELQEGLIPDFEHLWRRKGGDIREFSVPGNHLTVLREPGVTALANRLKEALDEIPKLGR